MNPKNFFAELKRRNVYKVAVAYAIVGWLLIQVATQVFPFFEIPNWAVRLVVLVIIIGFPIALIIAWAFELTPEGLKRTEQVEARSTSSSSRLWIYVALIAGTLSVGLFFLGRFTAAPKESGAPAAPAIPEKSIAVLPFENFSESKENEFFADGVQDDILTALAKVSDLKVISRTSVMTYAAGSKRNLREIAQALGVSHILEGSVRRDAGKVRVTAQLIDARSDAHLWADTYDRDLADVFAIQSEIAKAIAGQLQAKLSPTEKAAIEEPPTKDIPAHDLYVRAKLLNASSAFNARRRENLLEAARLLDQAVARDPDFLLAYCLLSNTHGLLYFYGLDHTPARRSLADAAVAAAIRLRPEAGETHLARADYFYRCYRDYDRARAELALAQRTLPNSAQILELEGYIDRRQGRWNESTQNLERALELDPRNWFLLQQISLSYQVLRRFPDMAAVLDRVLAIIPGNIDTRVARVGVDLDWKGDTHPLRETVEAIARENPTAAGGFAQYLILLALCERDSEAAKRACSVMPPQGIGIDQAAFPIAWWQGVAARTQGDSAGAQAAFSTARKEVERIVSEQPDYGPALSVLAMIDAGLGRKEEAIREGRHACEILPLTKDAINGANLIEFLAVIYAWTGQNDLAIEQLTKALQVPGRLSYGQLRLHPYWDPLRKDPRFEKIVASLAPK